MKRFLGVRLLPGVVLLATACFAISASGAVAAAGPGPRVVTRAPLVPHGATALGPVSASTTVSGAVVLQPRDEGALTNFIAHVTDKHSSLFHHYLTPGAFADRFGPTAASVDAVTSQLRAAGLQIDKVEPDRLMVDFSGDATKVEQAFGTGLERYRLADGSIGRASTGAVKLPSSIAAKVTSVVGLNSLVRMHSDLSPLRAPKSKQGTFPAAKASPSFTHPTGSPTACPDASTAAEEMGGLTDDQIAHSYGAFGLYGQNDFGAGQSVAIFELEPFARSDINTFDQCFFGSTAAGQMDSRLNVINVDGGQPEGPGSGESVLDIEDVSAFAPGANIDVYQAPNTTFGSIDQYATIINNDSDNMISSSWGLCEQAVQDGEPGILQAENLLFEQAAAQGMSVFSSAGDTGSNDCNAFRTTSPVDPVLSVDDPSSQPYVVSVGGTTIDDATEPASEHVWNDGAAWGAGGGGISESWPMPTWQLATDVPGGVNDTSNQDAVDNAENFMGTGFCLSDTTGGGFEDACRQLPDVSAQADEFTGAVTIFAGEFGIGNGWFTIGGTSSSTPMWAGMLADVNASPTCQNNGLTSGVGFVNPLLYQVASNPTSYAASFSDITQGNNDPYGASLLFPATTGYDMASGLGSPDLMQANGDAGLAFYLCNAPTSVTKPTVSAITPDAGSIDGGTVTITGTGFEQSGTPDVAAVQVGAFEIPPGFFNVTGPTTISADLPPAELTLPPGDTTDGAGRAQVTVTLDDDETTAPGVSSYFTYVDENGSSQTIPAVTSVHAYGGPESGGNTVEIFGAGFTGATDVTFGGVSVGAGNFTVDNDSKITATVPAYSGVNTTCDQDGSSFGGGEDATNDICQTQVVVTNANGSSQTSTIQPLYEGAFDVDDNGVIPAPSGQEASPAPTEYDYLPTPHITSISTTTADPFSLASEFGDSLVTIDGSGFNLAGLASVNFGDPSQESSQDFDLVSVTGTEIQIVAPPTSDITTDPTTLPVTVSTLASPDILSNPSNSVDATYAGIPSVSSVLATAGPTDGTNTGPDTGGTPIDVSGQGFDDQLTAPVLFSDAFSPFSLGTQYNFNVNSDTDLTTTTVGQNPAIVDVQVCTVTDCSPATSQEDDNSDVFLLFPPGDPKIDSITPSSGPETGGTQVTITGENLGCVTSISFGNVQAETFTNEEAFLICGLTDSVTVTAPPHAVGTVPVSLTTIESDATGASAATGSFTYTAAPILTVSRAGTGSGTVSSSPAAINCGATCSHKFAPGTSVTLTPTASAGSVFSGWSGGGCSGTGTCTVTTNSDTTVTATFDLAPETLTVISAGTDAAGGEVTSAPAGIDCGTTCSHQFGHGTSVTLTASGPLHSTFVGWSGACTGTGTCTVTMNSDTTVVATFNASGGPPPSKSCVVPNVKGKTLSAAKRALTAHHCKAGKISHAFSGKVKQGRVISQKPKSGKHLPNNAKVDLVVSKGKKKH